jgi:hypothetical protein
MIWNVTASVGNGTKDIQKVILNACGEEMEVEKRGSGRVIRGENRWLDIHILCPAGR